MKKTRRICFGSGVVALGVRVILVRVQPTRFWACFFCSSMLSLLDALSVADGQKLMTFGGSL